MSTASIDGNEAVARVAYRLNEVMAIYPITPATPMGEWADAWAAAGRPNLWGSVPQVIELQSEGGAAGVLHGALQAGTLASTFTASQGLLLMLPNLYKIAGELTATVLHVASRALAGQALSIFGDHGDVMATRGSGCALLCSGSVQEAGDFAAIATAASLRARLPFLHFFDGFRTSHEIQRVELIDDAVLHALVPQELVAAHRRRGLSPDHPVIRGTSQNPDVAFQAREAANPFHAAAPAIVQEVMDAFAALTGRAYHLFDYVGAADAERVLVLMGSGAETAQETVEALNAAGERVGLLKVRLFRPLDTTALIAALPPSIRAIAVLDRCKEPGSGAEPLLLDVGQALLQAWAEKPGPLPRLIGGRYGLASKDFTPAMVKAVFDALARPDPPGRFTVGITDDVTRLSLPVDASFCTEAADFRAIVYGLGSDGSVGANKNAIKIIGDHTDLYAQGYFVYDSKKSGSVTVSHLRVSRTPIHSCHLVQQAHLVACHQWDFLGRFDLLEAALPGGTLLLNSPFPPEEVAMRLPASVRQAIRAKQLTVQSIDATAIARELGLGGRINTVMQTCFFALADVLPQQQALEAIREAIRHSYGRKGGRIVEANLQAVDASRARLQQVPIADDEPASAAAAADPSQAPAPDPLAAASAALRRLIAPQLARQGDRLPVSALPADGSFATGTARFEKRNIAESVPVWDTEVCVQCGKCVMVCPHAVIRAKVVEPAALADAPAGFAHAAARDHHWQGQSFTLQVAAEDCTGCGLCVEVCPARNRAEPRRKAINMEPQRPLREQARGHWDFFLSLPNPERGALNLAHVNQQQLQEPLFEFSGACAGCGETPYIKLASQLFGDRMVVANATGCSSIYGGSLPTTPWSSNRNGRGPAWSNSLFEDNAEFGLGFRVGFDQRRVISAQLLRDTPGLPAGLRQGLLEADQHDEPGIFEQRQRVVELRQWLEANAPTSALNDLADDLVKRSVWMIGGDGWAYDIGYGGLDHVLAGGHDVNILVLDTEVYSNTGGQMSKATPLGAVAKFASGGKATAKKDLGLMAMTYGHVYVASVAMGASQEQTLRAFLEAESYPGPSLILAYSHCIAHGIDMAQGMTQQQRAVDSGRWLLYRHDPRRSERGENPLQLDCPEPKLAMAEAMAGENRFRLLGYSHPDQARALTRQAQAEALQRWHQYAARAAAPADASKGAPP
ncbi:pyruvate:ferredoxin (flavodoxin) oxidoreductase [Synechococcus sp. CS-602]|uniref:pyruvate:ferredoxin (flavodoxin) oxidoreductase n=1 Tax=Synechococcaceae TaxID=1890426 RepID=UPI0008FF1D45|nr:MULTISPECIES: pyruvate:ferredoxin (flavodoxin) oxidoreductase [Synechococcaceae]MCT4364370.1 pyruvate:ferredoxin (flavodoxin) oxidoreductase [Candidatus Regnicoccus frigidus MAG-AL1]APD48841.1 pyruvate:ferredoxin (flavodoxin) oxidoreductase [Synechococcus sp. SynAce01]MCT0202424.1 pyruvate:ferredoxin (flavodoxin) oxidoreductase [Synechococcus sp. CS-603]MCT0205047.1 pyruvate:ferredoxin (flavodoxin) oxidoreductase [Synechococcus sp. CS-602]MCT0246504.1 pyruvate:ferredoxin (flavodoxin) oxidor